MVLRIEQNLWLTDVSYNHTKYVSTSIYLQCDFNFNEDLFSYQNINDDPFCLNNSYLKVGNMQSPVFLTILLLFLHFHDTAAIHKDTTTSEQTDKHADENKEMYTVYEQVTDLLEIMDNFDRDVICRKLDLSAVDQLKSEEQWTVKFGKVFELLRQIVCTERIMP